MDVNSEKKLYAFGFYNLENLFDTLNDPKTLDEDFTENSEKLWNFQKLAAKTERLGRTIAEIGNKETNQPPIFIGVAEVENEAVLKGLVTSKYLAAKNYGYVHFDSPDERGIDTALLYRKEIFTVLDAKNHSVLIVNENGVQDFTRDILYVKGAFENQEIHILINHWPSRREGAEKTNYKRVIVAYKNRDLIAQILKDDPQARIVVMGDFNDDPLSESIEILKGNNLYNPMELLHTKYSGSLRHLGTWNLFDQILCSINFLQQHSNAFQYKAAGIYNSDFLQEKSGKFKGNPLRTYAGTKYLGGGSDHFPVYVVFSIQY